MKTKIAMMLAMLALAVSASAQTGKTETSEKGYKFTDGKQIRTTSVKNQYRSGTCWCFSTLSFIENEILRAGGEEMDLSEMWIVRHIYFEKAVKYARLHGSLRLAVGGASHDVTHGIEQYGIVPEEVYPGLNYGTKLPEFQEIDAVIKGYMDAVIKGKKLTTAWQAGLNGILDAYFGVRPETFTYKGREYTPKSFAESLPVKMSDYVSLTSFTHHPFYTQFVVEVPDNWLWASSYNVPVGELMETIDYALDNNYSVEWSTDVSERGFVRASAIGILPQEEAQSLSGTDAERWGRLSPAEREESMYSFDKPGKERSVTQEMRQEAFDNYETTDDHGMVIIGTATDQCGNPYFKVKNSWGVRPPYDGYYYFSRPFVEYKTMGIMVNRNAIPKHIRKKLNL